MAKRDSFFITTPIFYVNDVPHIGHGYTEVVSDVLARWHRQRGDDTFLLTGTDEHGQKILRTATANEVTPKQWADRLVESAWKPLLKTLDISNDDFIRTTDQRHEDNVKVFLQRLYDRGFIYTGEFEGYYCVGCEEYKQESDLVDGVGQFAGQKVCAIHSKPVELLKEKNYFFKMSEFTKPLLDLYEQHPDFIQPASARNEVVSFVKQGLTDLSISRSSFDWGIKLPWDESHVLYVWIDALLNYATAVGYGQDDEAFERRWPPQVHIVGKDILRFHAVIWPALLLAAGLDLPQHVFGHGWLLVGGEKMSKSKLTGIAPTQITDVFGSDAFRYYFLRAITFGHDGSFSWEDIAARYEAELANGFGNLASRTLAMIAKYFDGTVPEAGELTEADQAIVDLVAEVPAKADTAIAEFRTNDAISEIWRLVDALNGYITEQTPWAVAKRGETERLGTILHTVWFGLGALDVLLSPVIPDAAAKLWEVLGTGAITDVTITEADQWQQHAAPTVHAIEALFPRVDSSEVPETPVPQHQA
ncbi:methionine--tRNA ligase [Pseudoclavibacter sp. CFCC 13611]|uniref:methionine--tRNA ligase n=1 Tax=Pseudoclavibacter sp. CFCC 13611 TaxID=2615178 RepID=UPI0013012391|nr:methionine--tRNA ligase [Pseudoclavibacter sp. CFCC 13611]KAB1662665.1 methionine--tRNA ligase [Pseudoclavibacter sp. CFCC 13611]